MGLIGVIGTITLVRLLVWCGSMRRRRHGSVDLNPPLVEDDQLGGDNHLRNVLSSSYNGEDDRPLYP